MWKHRDVVLDLHLRGETITTTGDHPFWSETDGRFEDAADLSVGELVRTADGDLLPVEGLDWASEHGELAFNLTIEDFHTYYVGVENVWVHNCAPRITAAGVEHSFDRHAMQWFGGEPGPFDALGRVGEPY